MWLELELNISISERREEIKAENVSVDQTCETRPVTNRKELKKKEEMKENFDGHFDENLLFLPRILLRILTVDR